MRNKQDTTPSNAPVGEKQDGGAVAAMEADREAVLYLVSMPEDLIVARFGFT